MAGSACFNSFALKVMKVLQHEEGQHASSCVVDQDCNYEVRCL